MCIKARIMNIMITREKLETSEGVTPAMPTGKMPAAGEVAPDFELPDSTGKPRRLQEFFSQAPLVLVFYRGNW